MWMIPSLFETKGTIKFTMETEKDLALLFLNVLVKIMDDNTTFRYTGRPPILDNRCLKSTQTILLVENQRLSGPHNQVQEP